MAACERLVTMVERSADGTGPNELGLKALAPAGRLVDQVHDAIRTAVLSGSIAPGDSLSVPELSRRLAVSRSPVREAVLQLVADGIAVETPRKGVVVRRITKADMAEIHQIREFLEALAARQAAETSDQALVSKLDKVLDIQRRAIAQQDAAGYFATNATFHRVIAEASGNRRLIDMLASLEGQMALALRGIAAHPAHGEEAHREHRVIVEALARGDAGAAEAAMRRHIASTRGRLIAATP
jgi:DNA-binding GntR family transcriptional regulator